MEDQELGFKFIPFSARQPSWAVFAKPIPVLMVDRRSSFTTITAVVSNSSQGELENERTRLIKELQQTKDLCMSAENLQAMSITEKDLKKRSILEPAGALVLAGAGAGAGTYCKYYGLKGGNVVATTSGANMNFDILRLLTEPADVGRQREAVLVTYMPEEPKGAGTSKGEGEDDVTVQHERKDEAGTSNRKERIEGEGDDHVTAKYLRKYVAGTFKGKERIEDDVAAQYVRKDEAGTSKGKERIEGVGEGDASAQYMDAIGSVDEEPLTGVLLRFPLCSQPTNFALSQRAEERELNFALWEAREHSFALPAEGKENKNWVKGLGSVVLLVINIGICAATCIGVCLLNNNLGKKVDDLALQFKAVNEARVAAGCPPPTVCVLNPSITISSLFALFNFGNPITTVSTPVGLFNRGNPSITVSHLLGLFNINIVKSGNGVEESGRGSK